MSRRRVVITGAAGYLAAELARLLASTDSTVVRLARPGARLPSFTGQAEFVDLAADIRCAGIWADAMRGADAVFHLAAQTSVPAADRDVAADFEANVRPLLHLLEHLRESGLRPAVLFASTVTVAGIPSTLPVTEQQPASPVTAYDLHKWMAEEYLKYYVRQGLAEGAILRLANVYGPGPPSARADRGILNRMVVHGLRGEDLTIYGTGAQIRDYVYVEDAARAFLAAAEHMHAVRGRHFVIGSGHGASIAEAVALVAENIGLRTGTRPRVLHVDPPRPLSGIELRSFVADPSEFARLTGWRPSVSLPQGISRTVDYWLAEGGLG